MSRESATPEKMQAAESWLIELAQLELAWWRRVHPRAAIVAAEAADGETRRRPQGDVSLLAEFAKLPPERLRLVRELITALIPKRKTR